MSDQSQDLVDEIKLAVDASGVESGVGRAKRSIESLGDTVDNVGKRGGEGLNRMGQTGVEAGQKLDEATRKMVNSLQRQIAAAEAGGTATRQYQESIARLRGANMDVLRPYLEQLDAASVKTKEAERAVDSMAGTMRTLGNYLGGLAGGFAAYFSLRTFIDETIAAEQEQAQLAAVLRSTGEAAGWSREQLNEMAESLSSKGGKSLLSAGEINQAQARLLSYSNVVGDVFPRAMKNAIDMAQRMGMDVKSATETVGKALDVPSEGLTALQRQGFRFSEAQKELVERLEATGRTAEAQGLILSALESSYGGAAEAARNAFGGSLSALKNTINDLMTGEGGSVDSMREGIEDLNGSLGSPQTKQAFQNFLGWIASVSANAVTGAANLLAFVQASDKLAVIAGTDQYGKLKGQAQAYSHQLEQLTARAERYQEAINRKDNVDQNQRNLDRTRERIAEVQRQALAAAQALKDFAGQSSQTATQPEPKPAATPPAGAGSGKKDRDAARREAAEQAKIVAELGKSYAELNGLSSNYYEQLAKYQQQRKSGLITEEQYVDLVGKLIAKQPAIKAALVEEEKAREAALKTAQQLADARNSENAGIEAWMRAQQAAAQQSLQSVQSRVLSMKDEQKAAEISVALNISLAEAVERVAIARLEEKQAGFYEGSEGWEAIQREIDARRELLGLIGSSEARDANKRAADDAAKDWERTAQTISDTLADYIMGGGKDAAQYLKRLFATLVLQPVVQTGVGALLGAGPGGQLVSAAMGGAGGGSALLNNAGLVGAGAQAIWGLSSGASTASLVGANAVGMAGGDALGALIAGNGAWAGVGTGAGAAAGSGFMGALSAIPGWGWALAGIGLLGGLLGGLDDSGTPHIGGSAAWSSSQGLRTNLGFLDDQEGLPGYNPRDNIDNQFGSGMPWVQDNEQVRGTLGVMAQTLASTLDTFATAFGQRAGHEVALGFADDSSKDGSWGALRIALGDQELLNWNDDRQSRWAPRIFSDGEGGWKEFAAATAQDMRDVMTEMDIPGWVRESLEALGDSFDLDALGAVVTQIGAVNTAFDALGFGVAAFADMTDEARSRFINAAGGLPGAATTAGNYYDKFYSDDEKKAFKEDALSQEMERLGLAIPATREGFRELVEAQIRLGESGAETAARLMGLSDAAYEVLPAADEATGALRTIADAAKESFGITADTVKGLLDSILEDATSAAQARNLGETGFQDMVVSSIFDSLVGNMAGLVMAQIVAPLIAGATTSGAVLAAGGATGGAAVAGGGVMGGSASAAGGSVAGQAIAQGGAAAANAMIAGGSAVGSIVGDVLEAARAQMQAVSGLLQDPAFMEMLGELGQGFGNLSADLFDLKGSFGGGITSVSGSFDSAGKSADGLSDALSNLTGTIEDEIKRLRGIMEDASPNKGYDALMADFATTTAAARAGDEDALAKLPGLSKEIEALLPNRATSSAELAQMRGWLAGSMSETLKSLSDVEAAKEAERQQQLALKNAQWAEGQRYLAWERAGKPFGGGTAEWYEQFLLDEILKPKGPGYGLIPQLATGTNYVPEDMLAVIHKGEAVVPKEYNPAAGGQQIVVPQTFAQPFMGGESEVVAELRELRHEVAQLREQNEALALDAQRLRLRQARTQERTEGLIAMQEEKAGA